MSDGYIDFAPPFVGDPEIEAVVDRIEEGWLTTGPAVSRFEDRFRETVEAPSALALNSCTAALHLSLVTLGIGPGDEVITTPMTFCATANVIEHVGATPVLADVEADTLNIDPEAVADAVTERTEAVIPVHYTGQPARMGPLRDIAEDHDLHVIEDAAHALPAEHRGEPIGSHENPCCFSFYATKNMTTGEGGMLTGPEPFIEEARELSLHGMSRDAWNRYEEAGSWKYDVVAPGRKYNMTDMAAAMGLAQLERLDGFQRRRQEVWETYDDAFSGEQALTTPTVGGNIQHARHLYVLRLDLDELTIGRDRFIEELDAAGVGASVHFIPIHLHSHYRNTYGYEPDDFPVAYENYRRMLSLPLHPGLTDEQAKRVVAAVTEIVEKSRA